MYGQSTVSQTPKMMKNMTMVREDAARNLIVNYVPAQWDENQLRAFFSGHGHVVKAKLIMDQVTGASKGYGFITFSNAGEATRAMRELSGTEVLGKKLRVAYAQAAIAAGGPSPSVNVFISGFGTAFDEHYIRQLAAKHGEVQDVRVLDITKHPRGVAFVRFERISQAESCVNQLSGVELNTAGGPITLSVKFAERKQRHKQPPMRQPMHQPHSLGNFPFHMPHESVLEQYPSRFPHGFPAHEYPPVDYHHHHHPAAGGHMKTVFVHGLTGATEADIMQSVYSLFSRAGNNRIMKVDVPKHATGEPRNFCFVHMVDYASAHSAVVALDGYDIGGRQLQVRLK
ncbi:Protein elav [Diplonema papillatum]|nr:Protein elav [Diplonema papillatum]